MLFYELSRGMCHTRSHVSWYQEIFTCPQHHSIRGFPKAPDFRKYAMEVRSYELL